MTDNISGSGRSYTWSSLSGKVDSQWSGTFDGTWSSEELRWIIRTHPNKDKTKYGICDDCGRTMNMEEDCVCREND
jgi:hypothetical protein